MKRRKFLVLFVVGCTFNVVLTEPIIETSNITELTETVSVVNEEKSILNENASEIVNKQTDIDELNQPKVLKTSSYDHHIKVAGNDLFMWMYVGSYQKNPSPKFEKTTIVKFKKNGNYDTRFQLKDVRKALDKGLSRRTDQENKKIDQWDKFNYHAKANNGVECPGLIELLNRDGELKPVTVVIYGTQNIKHCALYKEFLEQQKQEQNREEIVDLMGQC